MVLPTHFSLACASIFSLSDSVGSNDHPSVRYIFITFPLPRNPQTCADCIPSSDTAGSESQSAQFSITSWAPFVRRLFEALGGGKVIQFHEFPFSFEIRFVFKSFLFVSPLIIFAISCSYFGIPEID
jgi:hypothetical protein